ncbi:hypothetical protein [Streptomyces sp. NPDC046712]|uniref:hypothetical protein n=1 Tax=Streptomyces sp. NPDC046712 TaxID=3154802 RepID=UPI0033FA17E9
MTTFPAALGLAAGTLVSLVPLTLAAAGPAAADPGGDNHTFVMERIDTTPSALPRRPRPVPHGPGGSMAETGGNGERLWLLGGLTLALAATGLVAKAALRDRGDH